ncbi:MAG TPA: hypothetical protein PKE29_07290 [Phycisphaerales bacterium]|nr:hypothetical protein [Phycisphaerales bacterium]
MRSTILVGCSLILALALGACTTYVTPGRAADFRALGITKEAAAGRTDYSIADKLDKRPLAAFPASIAVARVQGSGYYSHSERAFGSGRFSVVTTRTVETEEHIKAITSLPMVRAVAMLNRLVLPGTLNTEKDLREAAAAVQADMLLVYTFDTVFDTGTTIPALGTITLGLFPNQKASVTTTASAALIDTRNGYIYGLTEAGATDTQLANAWTSREAVDDCRKRCEKQAFARVVGEFSTLWAGVLAQYGPASVPAGGAR